MSALLSKFYLWCNVCVLNNWTASWWDELSAVKMNWMNQNVLAVFRMPQRVRLSSSTLLHTTQQAMTPAWNSGQRLVTSYRLPTFLHISYYLAHSTEHTVSQWPQILTGIVGQVSVWAKSCNLIFSDTLNMINAKLSTLVALIWLFSPYHSKPVLTKRILGIKLQNWLISEALKYYNFPLDNI